MRLRRLLLLSLPLFLFSCVKEGNIIPEEEGKTLAANYVNFDASFLKGKLTFFREENRDGIIYKKRFIYAEGEFLLSYRYNGYADEGYVYYRDELGFHKAEKGKETIAMEEAAFRNALSKEGEKNLKEGINPWLTLSKDVNASSSFEALQFCYAEGKSFSIRAKQKNEDENGLKITSRFALWEEDKPTSYQEEKTSKKDGKESKSSIDIAFQYGKADLSLPIWAK